LPIRSRLADQEQPAGQQDEVLAGNRQAQHLEQRPGQGQQPGGAGQHAEAHQHREAKADPPRRDALRLRQAVRQDGDEDEVVDAEHHLHPDQGKEGNDDLGVHGRSGPGFRRA
jgi:hypothetical protein